MANDLNAAAAPEGSPFPSAGERQALRARKRQALLLAAVRAFNERGFAATSLDDVAARLGVTKPVIYHHLGNKDQVLLECVRIGLGQLRDAADEAARRPGTALERLEAFLVRYGEIIMQDFGICVIRTNDQELSPDSRRQFRAGKREVDAALRGMIDAAVADGTAQAEDVRVAGFAIAGALNWTAKWYRAGGALSAEENAARLVRFLCRGIAARRD